MASTTSSTRPYIGWRLFALAYDFWPVAALWMVASLLFNIVYSIAMHAERAYVRPVSWTALLLWIVCWLIAGVYAVASWSRGGQTLGMRPWRLRVVGIDGAPDRRALIRRYAVGTLSLLLGGIGFWWAWFDRDRMTWHDRVSRTRVERMAKHG
ncbi:RDD family protein [Lysobacter claricitrinus]|uniref:RDD family protein n=1 Tax=Lysobacter claricitrinus TaxID=3367728 RepID=UPI0037DADF2C